MGQVVTNIRMSQAFASKQLIEMNSRSLQGENIDKEFFQA